MIIWLASYPKSGNTWVRSFISSILFTRDGDVDLSKLENISQFPLRSQFTNYIDDLQDVKKVYQNWSNVQNYMNLDNKIKFLEDNISFKFFVEFLPSPNFGLDFKFSEKNLLI